MLQNEIRAQKTVNNHQKLPNDFPMHLFASERTDKTVIQTNATREEPTSTMNHESENNFKYDANFRPERSSPTDSYDENGKFISSSEFTEGGGTDHKGPLDPSLHIFTNFFISKTRRCIENKIITIFNQY